MSATSGAPSSTGRAVTGWDLRALLAVTSAGLLIAALAAAGHPLTPLVTVLVVAGAGGSAAFPASPAPAAVCVLAVVILLSGDVGLTAWLVVVASLLHTVHLAAGLAEIVPARARAEAAALLPTFRRWLRAQLLTVPVLAALAAVLP